MGLLKIIKRALGIGGHAWVAEDFSRSCLKCGQFEESWVPAKQAVLPTYWRIIEKGSGCCRDERKI